MFSPSVRSTSLQLGFGLAAAGLLVAGCSSGGSSTPTSSSPTPTKSVDTVTFDKTIQSELAKAGCYKGPVDGDIGPMTDAAIVEFQKASNLPVTGELNAETDKVLKEAATVGRTVCTASPTATPTQTTATPVGATCTAASIVTMLPAGSVVETYTCAEGWVAGNYHQGKGPTVVYFGRVENGRWKLVPTDEVCGTAMAGLPPKILNYCTVS